MRLLATVSWVELSGYIASLLVFVAFYMKYSDLSNQASRAKRNTNTGQSDRSL